MLDALMREVQAILGAYGFIRALADLDRTDNALRFRLRIDETMLLLLTVVLPAPRVDVGTVVAILGYRITHNRVAYQSHRRKRLKHLAKLEPQGEQEVSL